MTSGPWGFGADDAGVDIYMGNHPEAWPAFAARCRPGALTPLHRDEIREINGHCGNGWRKVFNLMAKLRHAMGQGAEGPLAPTGFANWQQYREQRLLQAGDDMALHFGALPRVTALSRPTLLMGRTYGATQCAPETFIWPTADFAVHPDAPLLVTPYFDYRQLSNEKLAYLVSLLAALYRRMPHPA